MGYFFTVRSCFFVIIFIKIEVESLNYRKQVAQRATIAHLRDIMNIWGYFRCLHSRDPIWLKLKNELMQNIMYVLITCKFKKYQMNSNQETGFNACSYYLKVSKRLDRKQPRKGGNTISRIIRLWAYFKTFKCILLHIMWYYLVKIRTPPR